ncbi:MAG: hypothetical protein K6U74_10275 [Firmicutes bacterium]|nr:hypothetical protein [Bacillota bacterium]
MPAIKQAMDFDSLIDRIVNEENYITKDHLSVWGGNFEAEKINEFLHAWRLEEKTMPWRIWEHVHQITLDFKTIPGDLALLERGRAFGTGGDLSLRRDGGNFYWHFVGPPGSKPPAGFGERDFWAEQDEDYYLTLVEEEALLWGEERVMKDGKTCWIEDRVAKNVFRYPGCKGRRRVKITFREYSRAGRVQFVWYTGLRGWNE